MNELAVAAAIYLIWGFVALLRAGFVRNFNDSRVDSMSESNGANALVLGVFILFAILWCWLLWPVVLALFNRDRTNMREGL